MIVGSLLINARFIPTHVGNRTTRASSTRWTTVHPHARGEQWRRRSAWVGSPGSSPRTWGTVQVHQHQAEAVRFIPTHVGNSPPAHPRRRPATVHPHARGEQWLTRLNTLPKCGSSPRTWGTDEHHTRIYPPTRFIPTHVGNRSSSWPRAAWATVHPHARGEQQGWRDVSFSCVGSSPRTWGTDFESIRLLTNTRFIPTHVGNSPARSVPPRRETVHPHARGEQQIAGKSLARYSGSSPRTWGTVTERGMKMFRDRFIPTHVGNRRWQRGSWLTAAVHPHARGEQMPTAAVCT